MAAGSKTVTVKRGGSKPAATKPAAAKANGDKPKGERKPNAKVTKINAEVEKIAKALQGGKKMKEMKTQYGVSDDGPIRVALYHAGYDSKGATLPESRKSKITGTGAALAKKLITAREAGTPWYELAARTGQSEGDLRKLVSENGGDTGRKYRGR
jgi:hypothetical protein